MPLILYDNKRPCVTKLPDNFMDIKILGNLNNKPFYSDLKLSSAEKVNLG